MKCRRCFREIPDDSVFCNHCGAKQTNTKHKRGNGTGCVYKCGPGWRGDLTLGYDQNGRRIRRTKSGFKTKKEALEYIPVLHSKPEIAPRTLQYYYDSLTKSDAPKLSSSKQTAYRIAWNKIEPLHQSNVSDLTIVQLRDIVSEVAPTFYPARDIKSLLSHLLKLAVADQQITVNMSEYITLPKQQDTERTPWSDDELKKIWQAYDAEEPIAAYLILMIYSGMMPGELFACKRKNIHLDERQIIGTGLKTDVRKQTPIVFPSFVVPVIERILTFVPEDDDAGICYTNRWSFYDAYHEFTKAQGIRDLPIYSCRHTTASALAVGTNVAPSVIQKYMRHASFRMTQHYIHPDMEDVLSAAEKLGKK